MSSITEVIYQVSEKFLYLPFLALLIGSILLSFKTRFVQIRKLPAMFKLLFGNFFIHPKKREIHTVAANKALFTAMAATIGIGNIVAPVIAIGFGGPGALLGFMLATLFGGASTYTEVTLAMKHRKKLPDGTILGGPMQYLKDCISPFIAMLYAALGFILIAVWQSNQSNTLSTLLVPYNIPTYVSGFVITFLVLFALVGGIKRVSNIAEALVPLMFFLYSGATLWIIACNIDKLPSVIALIFSDAFAPKALGGAALGVGIHHALRWGLSAGFYSNEAGMGIAPIPHSMAETQKPVDQGILSMVSVYSNGFLCLLSGLTILITGIWQQGTPFDITMIVKALSMYFPMLGPVILSLSAVMFAFTTILGNGYNGSQCFLYATKNKYIYAYYILIGLIIFFGAVAEVKFVWALSDFFMAPVAVIHISSLLWITFRSKEI